MLWNPHNHSLLQDKDFDILRDKYGVKPWKFTQRSVSPSVRLPKLIMLSMPALQWRLISRIRNGCH